MVAFATPCRAEENFGHRVCDESQEQENVHDELGCREDARPTAPARRPLKRWQDPGPEETGVGGPESRRKDSEISNDRGCEQEWHHRDGEETYPDEHDGSYAVFSTSHCSPPTSKLERLYPQRLKRTGK